MEQVDKRFNKLEKGLIKADFSIFRLQEDVSQIKQDVTDLKASHERLVAWAHKVSVKTGIPLKDS